MTIAPNIRQELIRLANSSRTRRSNFTPQMPTDWAPWEAYDPTTEAPYTPAAAWDRVVEELRTGCTVQMKTLEKPPGKTGYVFKFADARGTMIYVKLQIVSGKVVGRSFHKDGK